MMNGYYGGGMMGGGWMMILVGLVCLAIIGAVVWLVLRSLRNKHASPLSSLPQHPPSQMDGQGYQPPLKPSTETYQEGEKQYSYPQSAQYPQQQERPPLN